MSEGPRRKQGHPEAGRRQRALARSPEEGTKDGCGCQEGELEAEDVPACSVFSPSRNEDSLRKGLSLNT